MISVSEGSIVIVIEAIFILSLFLLFFVTLLIKTRKKLRICMSGDRSQEGNSSHASVEHYLTTEIKLTEGRYELFYTDSDRKTVYFSEPDWLFLRKAYLLLEKELLNSKERDDNFWVKLGDNLKRVVSDNYLEKLLEVELADDAAEDETKELKKVMKEQADAYEVLLAELDGEAGDIAIEAIKEKLIKLSSSNKELSQCVFILEDENMFLREQIRGLLEMK